VRRPTVWLAWTRPEDIGRWFGPHGAVTRRAEMDVRVGGGFDIVFVTPDGEEHGVSGAYREVSPGRKLVFTWAWRSTPDRQSLVTVALAPQGKGTHLTLVHERFFDETARDNHGRGWTQSLERLAAFVVE
jgi:uncharacterized protein YndB with AHSA1/START domain